MDVVTGPAIIIRWLGALWIRRIFGKGDDLGAGRNKQMSRIEADVFK
jgi:hypothetical protein